MELATKCCAHSRCSRWRPDRARPCSSARTRPHARPSTSRACGSTSRPSTCTTRRTCPRRRRARRFVAFAHGAAAGSPSSRTCTTACCAASRAGPSSRRPRRASRRVPAHIRAAVIGYARARGRRRDLRPAGFARGAGLAGHSMGGEATLLGSERARGRHERRRGRDAPRVHARGRPARRAVPRVHGHDRRDRADGDERGLLRRGRGEPAARARREGERGTRSEENVPSLRERSLSERGAPGSQRLEGPRRRAYNPLLPQCVAARTAGALADESSEASRAPSLPLPRAVRFVAGWFRSASAAARKASTGSGSSTTARRAVRRRRRRDGAAGRARRPMRGAGRGAMRRVRARSACRARPRAGVLNGPEVNRALPLAKWD